MPTKKLHTSPTARSMKLLRGSGFKVARVEHWNAFAGIRQDLFGFGDLLAIRAVTQEILIVQATVDGSVSTRGKKIRKNAAAREWIGCGGTIEIHGWFKNKSTNEWEVRIVEVKKINAKLVEHKPPRRTAVSRQKELFG